MAGNWTLWSQIQTELGPIFLAERPNFAKLVKEISTEHLDPSTGCSKHVLRDLESAFRQLQDERANCNEQQLLYVHLVNCLTDTTPTTDERSRQIASDLLAVAETEQILQFTAGEEQATSATNLLGLSEKNVHATVQDLFKPKEIQDARRFVITNIEQRIRSAATSLAGFYFDHGATANSTTELTQAKMLQLPGKIKEDLLALQQAERALLGDFSRTATLYNEYLEVLALLLETLWLLLNDVKAQGRYQHTIALDAYLAAVVDNMSLKMELLSLEMRLSLYDEDTVQALTKIQDALRRKIASTEAKLQSATQKLNEYESLGDDFRKMANTYSAMLTELSVVEDDLRRLRVA